MQIIDSLGIFTYNSAMVHLIEMIIFGFIIGHIIRRFKKNKMEPFGLVVTLVILIPLVILFSIFNLIYKDLIGFDVRINIPLAFGTFLGLRHKNKYLLEKKHLIKFLILTIVLLEITSFLILYSIRY